MKKALITLAAVVLGAVSASSQQQSQTDLTAALAAAIQQNQQLQSYGDAWAARRGYTYNPWTSYYQYRAEREQRHARRNDPFFWITVIDEDR